MQASSDVRVLAFTTKQSTAPSSDDVDLRIYTRAAGVPADRAFELVRHAITPRSRYSAANSSPSGRVNVWSLFRTSAQHHRHLAAMEVSFTFQMQAT